MRTKSEWMNGENKNGIILAIISIKSCIVFFSLFRKWLSMRFVKFCWGKGFKYTYTNGMQMFNLWKKKSRWTLHWHICTIITIIFLSFFLYTIIQMRLKDHLHFYHLITIVSSSSFFIHLFVDWCVNVCVCFFSFMGHGRQYVLYYV